MLIGGTAAAAVRTVNKARAPSCKAHGGAAVILPTDLATDPRLPAFPDALGSPPSALVPRVGARTRTAKGA